MSVPPFDSTANSIMDVWSESRHHSCRKHWVAANLQSVGTAIVITIDNDIYKLLASGIVSCPIAFVSAISKEGMLASTNWSNTVTNYPPIISFACNYSAPGRFKDTIANLKNNQGFTMNIISEPFVKDVNATGIDAPPGFDEWNSGLTKEKCNGTFRLFYCPTDDNVADAFTKALPRPHLHKLRTLMSMDCARGGVLKSEPSIEEVAERSEIRFERNIEEYRE
ncbi:hypothetical protein F4604DRAFT_1952241 [Suillus subluteus]|nr:hypothetical protein F4604DRAFT_1952241 [Suillus subluteus]